MGPHFFMASTFQLSHSPRPSSPPILFSETGSHWSRLAEDDLELEILLSPYTMFWDFRPQSVPPYPEGAPILKPPLLALSGGKWDGERKQ